VQCVRWMRASSAAPSRPVGFAVLGVELLLRGRDRVRPRFRAGQAVDIGSVEDLEKDPLNFLHDSRVA